MRFMFSLWPEIKKEFKYCVRPVQATVELLSLIIHLLSKNTG